MEKRIFTPDEAGNFLTHWPEMDPEKKARIASKPSHTVYLEVGGVRERFTNVIAQPPIIVCPTDGGSLYLLNGKHRSLESYMTGRLVQGCIVHSVDDILNHLPRKCFYDLSRERLLDHFAERERFIDYCRRFNVRTIKDLSLKITH